MESFFPLPQSSLRKRKMLKFIKRRFFQLTDFSWQMNRSCSIIFFFFREIFVFVPICRYKRFSFQLSQYSVFQLWRVGGHVEIDQIIAKTLLPLDNSFFGPTHNVPSYQWPSMLRRFLCLIPVITILQVSIDGRIPRLLTQKIFKSTRT